MDQYSKSQIIKAGEHIKAYPPYPYSEETLTAFRAAHAWRSAHWTPMTAVRRELKRKVKATARHEYVTAARLKRLQSIKKKLRRTPLHLNDIQDIGGCRAILESIADLDALVADFRAGASQYDLSRDDDYITRPKAGGYRSQHLVLKVPGTGEFGIHNRLRIEVQFRTRLQHAWATAVEAVGLVRQEDLKAGKGDSGWLRFFEIMSAEFAVEEDRPLVPGVDEKHRTRLAELIEIEARLGAVAKLEGYNQVIRHVADHRRTPGESFVVRYDNKNRTVTVNPNLRFERTTEDYLQEEIRRGGGDMVMVEVDRVEDLQSAYPNYFLDVAMFTDRLKLAMRAPRKVAAPRPSRLTGHTLSWLYKWAEGSRRD